MTNDLLYMIIGDEMDACVPVELASGVGRKVDLPAEVVSVTSDGDVYMTCKGRYAALSEELGPRTTVGRLDCKSSCC